MGNAQSSTTDCPSFCKVICFGSAPSNSDDDGEWFGELPRKKDKKRRKSRKSVRAARLPSVPEETVTICSETTGTEAPSPPTTSPPPSNPKNGSDRVSVCRSPQRAKSEPVMEVFGKESARNIPKLTFSNGVFVDFSSATKEGVIDKSTSPSSIWGVEVSFVGFSYLLYFECSWKFSFT